MIEVGQNIPSVRLKRLINDQMEEVDTVELFAGKTSILFAVPGAFTPTCSIKHLPGFLEHEDAFKAKGVDQIVCLAVNDPFVLRAWARETGSGERVQMLPDGNAAFTRALGLEQDGSSHGMGVRARRFAMVIRDGKVADLAVEPPGTFGVSSAEAVLDRL